MASFILPNIYGSHFHFPPNFMTSVPFTSTPTETKAPLVSKKGINQLGGTFTNGKPLPDSIRQEIIRQSVIGVKSCEISRQLKVSHGCVSKILTRYYATGSTRPASTGGSKPKVATDEVISAIIDIKKNNPEMFAREVLEAVINRGLCPKEGAPSVSSVNRILRRHSLGGKQTGDSKSETEALQQPQITSQQLTMQNPAIFPNPGSGSLKRKLDESSHDTHPAKYLRPESHQVTTGIPSTTLPMAVPPRMGSVQLDNFSPLTMEANNSTTQMSRNQIFTQTNTLPIQNGTFSCQVSSNTSTSVPQARNGVTTGSSTSSPLVTSTNTSFKRFEIPAPMQPINGVSEVNNITQTVNVEGHVKSINIATNVNSTLATKSKQTNTSTDFAEKIAKLKPSGFPYYHSVMGWMNLIPISYDTMAELGLPLSIMSNDNNNIFYEGNSLPPTKPKMPYAQDTATQVKTANNVAKCDPSKQSYHTMLTSSSGQNQPIPLNNDMANIMQCSLAQSKEDVANTPSRIPYVKDGKIKTEVNDQVHTDQRLPKDTFPKIEELTPQKVKISVNTTENEAIVAVDIQSHSFDDSFEDTGSSLDFSDDCGADILETPTVIPYCQAVESKKVRKELFPTLNRTY